MIGEAGGVEAYASEFKVVRLAAVPLLLMLFDILDCQCSSQ